MLISGCIYIEISLLFGDFLYIAEWISIIMGVSANLKGTIFLRCSDYLKSEFNKAGAHFEFRDYTHFLRTIMRLAIIEYHEEKIDFRVDDLPIALRIELYGRGTDSPIIRAKDLHAASSR